MERQPLLDGDVARRPSGEGTVLGAPVLRREQTGTGVGDHRVLYEVQDDALIVLVIRIAHRRDVYRR